MAKTKKVNKTKTVAKKLNKTRAKNTNDYKKKKKVKPQTKKNKEMYVVLFYADWCPHCQHMKPEWEELKHAYENNINVKLIDIESNDSNKNDIIEELNKKVNPNNIMIDGYPTILSVDGNEVDYYRGERTANMMGGWIRGKMTGGYRKDLQGKASVKNTKSSRRSK